MAMRRLDAEGVALELDGVQLFEDGKELKPDVRHLGDIKGVLMDQKAVTDSTSQDPTYYMYRQVGFGKSDLFRKNGLRYDITVIPRYDIGMEFNKTLGHYHSIAEKGLSYPELYEVIEGEAFYIFQKPIGKDSYDTILINAKAGDKVLVPPNYGHITVNRGRSTLVMANLVSDYFKPDYESIVKMRGGAVYALKDGSIILNKNYKSISVRYRDEAERLKIVRRDADLYDQFLADPNRFEFLQKPHLLSM